jgi:UDP-N-acetylmuramate dehydrogenase
MPVDRLAMVFGPAARRNVALAPYTSARIGGPADLLIAVKSASELEEVVRKVWQYGIQYTILGGGSNVLVSDKGVRGLVILNRARGVQFDETESPLVRAESGVVFSNLANRCAAKGLGGLEWAGTVPGTIGGAVYGNAGAFGGDMAGNLRVAEISAQTGRQTLSAAELGFGYRTSLLKRGVLKAVVLSTELRLTKSTKESVTARMEAFSKDRKRSQPPGASMGSMFKNPEGDTAGRLIEAAGLKGTHIGGAEISPLHANFFINHGKTSASDIRALIEIAQRTVQEKCGVELELEIEFAGEW